MKKLLSLLLAAALLLSVGVCAYAEEDEGHSHRVSDAYIIVDDQILDLSNIVLELDANGDAGLLHLDADGERVAEIGLALIDGGVLVLHMDSELVGHRDYAVDLVDVLAKVMASGIEELQDLLDDLDPQGMAEMIVDALLAPRPAAPEEPEEPAPSMPDLSIQGDFMSVITDCFSEPETVHMGGTEYDPNGGVTEMPDGEYEETSFTFDIDTLCQLLNMVCIDGAPAGLGDMVRDTGVEFSIDGTFYAGEEANVGQISVSYADEESSFTVGGSYNQTYNDVGSQTVYSFGASIGDDPDTMSVVGLSFTVSDSQHEGEMFSAADIDEDELIMLNDMSFEEAVDEVMGTLDAFMGDVAEPFVEAAMEAEGTD